MKLNVFKNNMKPNDSIQIQITLHPNETPDKKSKRKKSLRQPPNVEDPTSDTTPPTDPGSNTSPLDDIPSEESSTEESLSEDSSSDHGSNDTESETETKDQKEDEDEEESEEDEDDEDDDEEDDEDEEDEEDDEEEEDERKRKQQRCRKRSDEDTYKHQLREEYNEDLAYRSLSDDDKARIIQTRWEMHQYTIKDLSLKYRLLLSNLPLADKISVMSKIDEFESMRPTDSEYHKLRRWLDGYTKIPFGKYASVPVSRQDPPAKIAEYIDRVHSKLNEVVYGHDDVKQRILQVITQWITNPQSRHNILCLQGAPGLSKTVMIKDAVAKALNIPFAFIPLGGMNDVSALTGHNYTWEGSTWGRMIQILMDTQCMNPIVFMDELDKIAQTTKGQEVSNFLMSLIDPSQNDAIRDQYFANLNFDFSRCFFVFTLNDLSLIHPVLRNRLNVIQLEGYNNEQKEIIARNYMIPKMLTELGMSPDHLHWDAPILRRIIEQYGTDEPGVRNLKRALEYMLSKINVLQYGIHGQMRATIPPDIIARLENISSIRIDQPLVDFLYRGYQKKSDPTLMGLYI